MVLNVIFLVLTILSLFSLWLLWGIFKVSSLDRRDHRAEELAFLSEMAIEGQTVFLGDSITQYCPVEEIYSSFAKQHSQIVYNRGITSETSLDALNRLEHSVLVLKPSQVVILLGCNDIGKLTKEQTVSNIEKIIDRIRELDANVKILLQAVYPIRETKITFSAKLIVGRRTNEKVRQLNKELEKLAKKKHVFYLDLTELLRDEEGQLKQSFTRDGLHVNAKAYREIAKCVIPLLEEKNEE